VSRFEPFPGVRYAAGVVRLDQLIAPPYDVVGSAERDMLAHRHPLNAIHLELPMPELRTGRDRYLSAADLLDSWLDRRALVPDPAPSFYPYRMTTPGGDTTVGVIGALTIDDDVLPHEETMAKPRSDRLDLLRATGANLSPIWGLSLTGGLTAIFAPDGPADEDAYDDNGVRHELWVMDDAEEMSAVAEAVAASPVVIADGHHRYETARTYRDEARAGNGGRPGDYDAVMALVVELTEEQLHVRAIHRLLEGLPAGTDLLALFSRFFDAVHAGPASERVLSALVSSGSLGLVTPEGAWLLTVRTDAFDAAGTDLEAGLVDIALREVPSVSVSYTPEWQEALASLSSGNAQAAVLLRPVSVSQIRAWASARRRMPAKTTYFSPKPRTGMVFRVLSG
jgi:uncharacterized protein (DUF1015 family)